MISFVQMYLPIQKSNREIEIDATVVIANIEIETDMVGIMAWWRWASSEGTLR